MTNLLPDSPPTCKSVYGPVESWRFGRSLGVDPIGAVSTCSFNCAYCQLGDIQHQTDQRQVFVPTRQILQELAAFQAIPNLDVITLSGSGEPTLALNLGNILTSLRQQLPCPVVVLTNGTLLGDAGVQTDLLSADLVVVKLDAVSVEQLQRVNRPCSGINFETILAGIRSFAASHRGKWALQTMMLAPWSAGERSHYIQLVQALQPTEVQLNIPRRPRVLERRLDARGNHVVVEQPEGLRSLNCISNTIVREFAQEIEAQTNSWVRYPA
ncbi:MAG: radical SAM protein [Leptolyngbyaceae bacterium]|nr:radical SAM protein [Leptolyngbyaceae bacterium]